MEVTDYSEWIIEDLKSFKEAKVYARSLKLKNVSDWYKLSKKRILSKDIPLNAERVYKNKGWKGWGDFLGTGTIATKFRNFLPFKKARTYVRSLKLKIFIWKRL